MSCINRKVGNTPVEPGFAKVQGRPKWAIPWMEDDPGLTMPQLWAARMRRDAADARKYGCTGLMGIHWRTRILGPERLRPGQGRLGPNRLEGEETLSTDGKLRYQPIADFYADWARSEFGPEAAEPIAAIFTRLDSHLPRPADWVTGPGSIRPDAPLAQVQKEYAFVDQLAALRPQVTGAGQPRTLRLLAQQIPLPPFDRPGPLRLDPVQCGAGQSQGRKGPEAQKKLARESVLPGGRNWWRLLPSCIATCWPRSRTLAKWAMCATGSNKPCRSC